MSALPSPDLPAATEQQPTEEQLAAMQARCDREEGLGWRDAAAALAEVTRLRAENTGLRDLHDVAIAACTKAAAQRDAARAERETLKLGNEVLDASVTELRQSIGRLRTKLEQARAELAQPTADHMGVYLDPHGQVYCDYPTMPPGDDVVPLVYAAEVAESKADLAEQGRELRLIGWCQ